jgi:hypothetical protein
VNQDDVADRTKREVSMSGMMGTSMSLMNEPAFAA